MMQNQPSGSKIIINEVVRSSLSKPFFELKMVFNENGAILFLVSGQHREHKGFSGAVSYEDESKGNALAAMLKRDRVEVRRHNAFSIDRVRTLLLRLSRCEDLLFFKSATIMYGSERINLGMV